jgi:DNA-binding protein HU-beta
VDAIDFLPRLEQEERCAAAVESCQHACLPAKVTADKKIHVFRPKNAKNSLRAAHRARYIASSRPNGQIAERRTKPHMAAGPMTKSQLINHIAEEAEVPRKTVVAMLEALSNVAYKEAKKGFTFPGLGKLVLVNRKARTGRNPATGEAIKIPAKKVLKFRIAKAAKDAIIGVKK